MNWAMNIIPKIMLLHTPVALALAVIVDPFVFGVDSHRHPLLVPQKQPPPPPPRRSSSF